MFLQRARGFSLLELMIVIAIILFLAKLAIPRLKGYLFRARQTEVAINLASLYTAEHAHQLEHGRFTTDLRSLGWQPNGYHNEVASRKNYCTYGFFGSDSQEGVSYFSGSAQTPPEALGTCSATTTTFIARAAVSEEGVLHRWLVNEQGVIEKEPLP